jgi:alpha-galactosidase
MKMSKTIKPKKRSVGIFYAILTLLLAIAASPLAAQHTLAFGSDGEIRYDASAGTATIVVNEATIITNAYAVVKDGAATLNSKNYANRTVTFADINDAFGAGKKMTVTLTGTGLPEMTQIFYGYGEKDYFLTEVIMEGTNISTNYMAPLVADAADIQQAGNNRVLFVPFDNDAFVRYRSLSMSSNTTSTSSEVTAYYENTSRKGLVVGSVEHMTWKTGVRTKGTANTLTELTAWGGYTDVAVTRDKIVHGTLSGDSVKSPKIFVGFFEDWRKGLEDYGKANALAEPRYVFDWTAPTPFGWNSWGVIQTNLNLDKSKAVAAFFKNSLPQFRNGETAYIDLDSYWDNMVSGGLEGDFSQLVAFVNYCKERGLKPGIYWGPFVDWGKVDRPVEGSTYRYPEIWTKVNGAYHDLDGGRAIDPTHPATHKRIDLLIDKLKTCGFEMIKIDFIGHASFEADSYFDPSVKTGMQAFRKGMEYLIDRLDDKMLVYAAISPNLATGRYAHSRRIACDAYSDINATEYTLNSTTYGWWQTHVYNFIDADHIVFRNEAMGANRARLTSGLINGTLITGDDFSTNGQWSDRARLLLQKQDLLNIARNGVAFMPVEGNSEQSASEVFVNRIGEYYYVAVINYGEKKLFDLPLERLGITAGQYTVKELFSEKSFSLNEASLKREVEARDAMIFRFRLGTVTDVSSETGDDTVTIYPNPARSYVRLTSANKKIHAFKVFDQHGKMVEEGKNVNSREYDLSIAGFVRGVYFVSVVDMGGKVKIFKVVKE